MGRLGDASVSSRVFLCHTPLCKPPGFSQAAIDRAFGEGDVSGGWASRGEKNVALGPASPDWSIETST